MSGDLLNKMGSKTNSVEGAGKQGSEPKPAGTSVPTMEINRGEDMLAKAGKKVEASNADAESSGAESSQSQSASGKEEPAGSNNPEGWTTDSALKEVRKLREENKQYRVKYMEQLDKIKTDGEAKLQAEREEKASLLDAKKELDRIKAEQEDKKRDLSEKIAHREARIAELQAITDAREKAAQEKIKQMETRLHHYEADRQAEMQVYQGRLDEELAKVPEKFKEYANLLAKGAGDARDALITISEAKLKGMFEDRTVIINHSVPGASEGARSSKERMEMNDKERRAKLSSTQKIGEALKDIRSGAPNSVFRTK
jgi:hypothetical protein